MPEHFDVLIVGAGISGIGATYHLTQQCPDTGFVILEAQEGFGGTWRTHRFPGIRSDTDLYTFGYRFKPWSGPPIATADSNTARERSSGRVWTAWAAGGCKWGPRTTRGG